MVLRVPTSAGSTLGKRQETVGARSSCLLPQLPIPLFKPLGCGNRLQSSGCRHKRVEAGLFSQLTLMWARIIETAKENEAREERESSDVQLCEDKGDCPVGLGKGDAQGK